MAEYTSPALNELQRELDRTGVVSNSWRNLLMSYALECHAQGYRRAKVEALETVSELFRNRYTDLEFRAELDKQLAAAKRTEESSRWPA